MWVFDKAEVLFKDFIDSTIEIKKKFELENKNLAKIFKFGLNSSYGVFAQKQGSEKTKTCSSMDELLELLACYDVTSMEEIDQDYLDVSYKSDQKEYTNLYHNFATGASIVNYAKQYVDEKIIEILGKLSNQLGN